MIKHYPRIGPENTALTRRIQYILTTVIFLFTCHLGFAQGHGFKFGEIAYKDFERKTYDPDTAAVALVLNEFGEAYVDGELDGDLIFNYHTKIMVLKKGGLEYADVKIPLYRHENRSEEVISIKASSFTIDNGSIKETKLEQKSIFSSKTNEHWTEKAFAVPNVRVGSIIEIQYVTRSPFMFNFHNWEFQSDIPKLLSEYWASIPGNYKFNITIRGFLNLDKNEGDIIRDCFAIGGGMADCARYKWAMRNIPAFRDEDYMTARSNFLSAIKFELSEVKDFHGRTDKYTKEWKDAEQELRLNPKFGVQLKRGKAIVDDHIELLVAGETDPMKKAQKIYEFIKNWYRWDELYSKYSELGVKEAFDQKTGNVGDINLSLIAALRYAGIETDPVLLSTRNNGLATELHPVLSEFNYVIARSTIGDKSYLLDATDRFMPFGFIPQRCLNGKGRVLGEKESYWVDLIPLDKARFVTMMSAKIGGDRLITGSMNTTFFGYEAIEERKSIARAGSVEEYIKKFAASKPGLEIKAFKVENVDDLAKPLIRTLEVQFGNDNIDSDQLLFNPFLSGRWDENPFKSNERLYPVDFGTPLEQTLILTLEYPEGFGPVDLPKTLALSLPNSGGRYVFDVKTIGNKLNMTNRLWINKAVFSANEYHFLKELFANVVSTHQSDFYFRKN